MLLDGLEILLDVQDLFVILLVNHNTLPNMNVMVQEVVILHQNLGVLELVIVGVAIQHQELIVRTQTLEQIHIIFVQIADGMVVQEHVQKQNRIQESVVQALLVQQIQHQ